MDVALLSRIQFALTSAFHYFFPPFSIGVSLLIVAMEAIYLKTKDPRHLNIVKFWVRLFAVFFSLGVATGIVLEFEFGTNWANYSRYVGDVFGSALGAEGIFAFFLESGFLAILLFGWNRVGPKMHFFSSLMVCLGAHFSAVWIIIANSWMQTPAGYHIVGEGVNARAEITDFWQLVFNPSSMERLTHTVLGAWLAGAFLVISICAYYLLKKKHEYFAKFSMKVALIVAVVATLLQGWAGDSTARGVAKNQPEKLAALEGLFDTQAYAPASAFGWVDMENQTVKSPLSVKGLLSFLVSHNPETVVKGLNEFPRENWPNVQMVYQVYHVMILMYGLILLIALMALIFWKRGTLFQKRWFLKVLVISFLFPFIANETGWMTAELGRQPWVVYHVLKTVDGISPGVSGGEVAASLIMFTVVYLFLFVLFLVLLGTKISHGPGSLEHEPYRNPFQPNKKGGQS